MPTSTLAIIFTIVAIAILLIFLITGYRKGFLRIVFSTFALLVTIIAASFLTKPVGEWLRTNTFIGSTVEKHVQEYVNSRIDSFLNPDTNESEISTEAAGTGTDDVLSDHTFDISSLSDDTSSQESFIHSLALPEFIKKTFIAQNTLQDYARMQVESFSGYITAQLTGVIVNAIAFILLIIAVYLILRILMYVLHFINRIPVIRGINRLLGAFIGLAEGLIIIWLIFVILMIFSGSEFGTSVMKVIRASTVLSFLYDNNLLTAAAKSIFTFL